MEICERCGKETNITTMSWFNTQIICMDCDKKEQKRPDFQAAKDADSMAVKAGNFNFKGIGIK